MHHDNNDYYHLRQHRQHPRPDESPPASRQDVTPEQLSETELINALDVVSAALRQESSQGNTPSVLLTHLRRQVQTHGLRSAVSGRAERKALPWTTPPSVVEQMLALSQEYPTWSPYRLEARLAQQGVHMQAQTIYHHLAKRGLGKAVDRLRKLDVQIGSDQEKLAGLSPESLEGLKRINPCYRDHTLPRTRPGDLLTQGAILLQTSQERGTGTGRLCLHVIMDMYSSYVFAAIAPKMTAGPAIALLHNVALPYFRERHLPVRRIRTDDRRAYYSSKTRRYSTYLALYGITHDIAPRAHGQSGFVERFVQLAQGEFFADALGNAGRYPTLEALQDGFARWLASYNYERAYLGYPNGGKRPIEIINAYLAHTQAAS